VSCLLVGEEARRIEAEEEAEEISPLSLCKKEKL